MSFIEKFHNFLASIFSLFSKRNLIEDEESVSDLEELLDENILNQEEKIDVGKRTLMTKLYMLEQEITVFETDFPDKYNEFMEKIKMLKDSYESSLEERQNQTLTFEIDPDLDYEMMGRVVRLQKEIKHFIECDLKYNIIKKRLQRLILKLNILYNVSIFHSKEDEKEKVMSRIEQALESETGLAYEIKECDYILLDKRLKEEIINLIAYADYEIFKTSIRNSKQMPDKIIEKLVLLTEFDGFDYTEAFKAFIKDEISDLSTLLPLVCDHGCRKLLKEKQIKLLRSFTYSENTEYQIIDICFWNNLFDFESSLLEMLKESGVDKDKAKVCIIDRMNISLDENEVIVLPKTNTYLSLTSIYSKTQNENILLFLKLLRNVSNDVTYKEIYFLILLFDIIRVITNTPNELARHMQKYLKKYPYDNKTIMEKKRMMKNSLNKEYVFVFNLNEYQTELIDTLEKLNFDFKVVDNNVFVNSFYFNGLDNVLSSLQEAQKHNDLMEV